MRDEQLQGDTLENDEFMIEFEIGDWDTPLTLQKGMKLDWNSNSIEVIQILAIEFGNTVHFAKLLVKAI
jgi:hypothetical protein